MEILQIMVYCALLVSLLLTIAMSISNMVLSRKRDKAFHKMLDDLRQKEEETLNELLKQKKQYEDDYVER